VISLRSTVGIAMVLIAAVLVTRSNQRAKEKINKTLYKG